MKTSFFLRFFLFGLLALGYACTPPPSPSACAKDGDCPPSLRCSGEICLPQSQPLPPKTSTPQVALCSGNPSACAEETTPDASSPETTCGTPNEPCPDHEPECRSGETRLCDSPSIPLHPPCQQGTQTCEKGKWGECSGEVAPTQEVCFNELDDDCDGKVDEGCPSCQEGQKRPCYTGQQGCILKNKSYECFGLCKTGTSTCVEEEWGACVGEQKPQGEICRNRFDEDCDGQIDEDCPPTLHEECNDTDNKCAPDEVCMTPQLAIASATPRCYQLCKNSGECAGNTADGRVTCALTPAHKGSFSICIKIADHKEKCDPSASQFCKSGMVCQDGRCHTVAKEYEYCSLTQNISIACEGTLSCTSLHTTYPTLCYKSCQRDVDCSTGLICKGFRCVKSCTNLFECQTIPHHTCDLSKQICVPRLSDIGQRCAKDALPPCKEGLDCLSSPNEPSVCAQPCHTNKPCPSGRTCQQVANTSSSYCASTCAQGECANNNNCIFILGLWICL